ncbi:hypothetical protein [Natroniella sp. ANB-PHB2]|uniref:hypothetical protein n=1 Tax=Natroniella sp. ANB-PHB2 TaxID=3384444 RepID=UPI0038D42F84
MIDYKILNQKIDKYLINKSQNNFLELKREFIRYKFPKWKIEKLIESNKLIPNKHLGFFYLWAERLLEASFYFEKHLEGNQDDCHIWINLQHISSKRGDLHTSSKALKEINRLGEDYQVYRGLVIHNMASGFINRAVKYARELIRTENKEKINISIFYELAIMSEEWEFISWIIKFPKGKRLLKNCGKRDVNTLKNITINKLIEYLDTISEENNSE